MNAQKYSKNNKLRSSHHPTFSPYINTPKIVMKSVVGNQAIQRHSNKMVSKPNDPNERRADRVADSIMSAGAGNSLSRLNPSENNGSNRAFPKSVQDAFQPHLPNDLSAVKFRNDAAANRDAQALNARAYTENNTITFARGQYDTRSREGQRLLAHELAHASDIATGGANPNTIYRETWDIDDSAGTVERGILVQLIFENTWTDWWNDTGWTTARKNTFRSEFESSIENTFNNSGMVLNPPASAADVLPPTVITNGYRPLVDINLVPDGETSTSEDWEVDVSSNPSSEFRTSSSNRSYGTLDEADNDPIAKSSSAPGVTQIPTVHEFGHFIGLDHPGHGLDSSELSSGASEYGHSGHDEHGRDVHGPTDLMGGGMGLRPFYFNEWAEAVDDHIASLRRQRSLEELQRAIENFFSDEPEMGDFPLPSGNTRMG